MPPVVVGRFWFRRLFASCVVIASTARVLAPLIMLCRCVPRAEELLNRNAREIGGNATTAHGSRRRQGSFTGASPAAVPVKQPQSTVFDMFDLAHVDDKDDVLYPRDERPLGVITCKKGNAALGIMCGAHCAQGNRPYMEDAICVVPAVCDELEGFDDRPQSCFFGVYDGHGGYVTSAAHGRLTRTARCCCCRCCCGGLRRRLRTVMAFS